MSYGPFELATYPCGICGSAERELILNQPGRATGLTFRIVRCSTCDHVRTDPRISDDRLGELYDEAYYRGEGFDRSVDYEGPVSQWTIAENARIAATIGSVFGGRLSGVRWLDFGCGTGALLETIRAEGVDGVGFDESPAAIASCARKNVPTLSRRQLEAAKGSFDVVSAIEVIEHVPSPVEFLRELVSYVRLEGVVYVHTENWNVVRYLPGRPYVMPEGHIQYFTPRTMRRIFDLCGLREAKAFNRSWFGWRRLPRFLQSRIPERVLTRLQIATTRFVPSFAPFPVGHRAR